MKSLIVLPFVFLLSSCMHDDLERDEPDADKAPKEVKMNMPVGLSDCKTFRVHGEGGYVVLITRCPHSETTTTNGKVRMTVAEEEDSETELVH